MFLTWLQLQHVFDELDVMKNYTGQVLLLEEDYYLAPDIITTLQMTLNLKKKWVALSSGIVKQHQNKICSLHQIFWLIFS